MKQYIVDAFTDRVFSGNPAAVCIMDKWPDSQTMQNIAIENNLSETAFAVKEGKAYHLRWFTPGGEVSLCGHATLGTSFVLFHYYESDAQLITYHTLSGDLFVSRKDDFVVMDFPAYKCNEIPVTNLMVKVMGAAPAEAYLNRKLLLIYDDENIIRNMKPDFVSMKNLAGDGVGVSAPGLRYDCVSRFFAPKHKVNEDPVTGSVHCLIVPYWAERLGKNIIHAYQASERGGELHCELCGSRVKIAGKAVLYAEAYINI